MWRTADVFDPGERDAPIDEDRALFDPLWLRRSFRRCLWDGGERARGSDFCGETCRELYESWEGLQVLFDRERALEVFEDPDGSDRG